MHRLAAAGGFGYQAPERTISSLWGGDMNLDTSAGHPDMDYTEHKRTYAGFVTGVTWGVIFVVVLLALMAFFLV